MKKNLLFTTALVAATFSASGEGEQSNPNLIFDEGLSNEDLKEGIEFANSAEGNLALKDNLLYNYDKSELKDGKLGISKKDADAGVTAELNNAWEVSAGYEGKFRDDYKDHSGILSAKYKF